MSSPRRFLAATLREVLRPSWLGILAGYLFLAALLGVLAAEEHDIYFQVVYVLLPLGLAPLAARAMARERESGMALVHATSPLRPWEALLAKLAALQLMLLAGVVLTIPLLAGFLANAGDRALAFTLSHPAWALVAGTMALAAGALVGLSSLARGSLALSVAFGLVIAWMVVASEAGPLVGRVENEAAREAVGRALHLSPAVWVFDDELGFFDHPYDAADGFPPMLGAALVALALLALAALVRLRLQEAEGWLRPLRRQGGAVACAVAVGVAGLVVLAAWPLERASGEAEFAPVRSRTGTFSVQFAGVFTDEFGLRARETGDRVLVNVDVLAERGRVVTMQEMRAEGEQMRFREPGPLPPPTEVGWSGKARLQRAFTAKVDYAGGEAAFTVVAVVENETFVLKARDFSRDAPGNVPLVALAGGVPAVALGVAAFVVPRRLNKW